VGEGLRLNGGEGDEGEDEGVCVGMDVPVGEDEGVGLTAWTRVCVRA
jgi:hypothetical protein